MSTIFQRRQAMLDAFEQHEEMHVLFDCLARSPSFDGNKVDEGQDPEVCDRLIALGLLADDGAGWLVTTPEGRAALAAYVNGEDQEDE